MKLNLIEDVTTSSGTVLIGTDSYQQGIEKKKRELAAKKKQQQIQQVGKEELDTINKKMQDNKTHIDSQEAIADIQQYLTRIKLVNG